MQNYLTNTLEDATDGWAIRFAAWIVCAIILSPFLWIAFVVDCLFIHHFAVEKTSEGLEDELDGLITPLEEATSRTSYSSLRRDKSFPDLFDTEFHRARGYLGNGQWDLTLGRDRT